MKLPNRRQRVIIVDHILAAFDFDCLTRKILHNIKRRHFPVRTIFFGNEANLQTRLGLRWLSEQNTASTKKDSFFAEVNWLHNSNNYTISSLGDSVSQDGNKNLGELRLGYEKEFNKDWFISADLSGRFGSNSYSSFQGMLSLEYLF